MSSEVPQKLLAKVLDQKFKIHRDAGAEQIYDQRSCATRNFNQQVLRGPLIGFLSLRFFHQSSGDLVTLTLDPHPPLIPVRDQHESRCQFTLVLNVTEQELASA